MPYVSTGNNIMAIDP